MKTATGTVYEHNGRVIIRMGKGGGEIVTPRGTTFEAARRIACEIHPLGTPNRRKLILDELHDLAKKR